MSICRERKAVRRAARSMMMWKSMPSIQGLGAAQKLTLRVTEAISPSL